MHTVPTKERQGKSKNVKKNYNIIQMLGVFFSKLCLIVLI